MNTKILSLTNNENDGVVKVAFFSILQNAADNFSVIAPFRCWPGGAILLLFNYALTTVSISPYFRHPADGGLQLVTGRRVAFLAGRAILSAATGGRNRSLGGHDFCGSDDRADVRLNHRA